MTTLSVKIDDYDKSCFEEICNAFGLNLSSAVNAFVKVTIRNRGLPLALQISDDEFFYPEKNLHIVSCKTHYTNLK